MMTDEQAEMAATEVPELPPDLPPSPAEHMPPTPDPMQVIEPLLGVLQELAQVSSRVADCARDVKWQLGGLVLTAHEMAPLAAPAEDDEKQQFGTDVHRSAEQYITSAQDEEKQR